MTDSTHIVVRWGQPGDSTANATGDVVWPDLDPIRHPGHWTELLRRVAAIDQGNSDIFLLKHGFELVNDGLEKLRAAANPTKSAIVAALDNLSGELSPLPPGTALAPPYAVAAVDRTCAWLGQDLAFPLLQPGIGAALWTPGTAQRLLDSEWTPDRPLPPDVTCIALDTVFAGDPEVALSGPPPWPLNHVPVPTEPLEFLRSRWPTDEDSGAAQLPQLPPVPMPSRNHLPVVLHVCHGWGGGSLRFIRDLAEADSERCHLLLSARGDTPRQQFGEWLELGPAADPDLIIARYPVFPPITDTAIEHAVYEQVIEEILARWRVDAVMVSSLIGHGLAALRTGKPTLVVCHDYYPLWPELHRDFGNREQRFDKESLTRDLAAGPLTLFRNHDADYWWRLRESLVQTLLATRPQMAAPTGQARDNWLHLAPTLADLDWSVVPHGLRPWPVEPKPAAEVPDTAGEHAHLRVLVPGRIAGGKGLELLRPLLDRLDRRCELVLIGAGTAAAQLHGKPRVHVLGDYSREELPQLVAAVKPDLALLPASVAETFGYLLSELQSLGLPVLATAIGSYAERIVDGVDGLLVKPDAGAIAERLRELADDTAPLGTIRQHLASAPSRSTIDMAQDYRRLLPLPGHDSLPRPAAPTWRDLQQAWLARRALEIDRHRDRLHAELKQAETELAHRADWGFDLGRQLAERTRWAQSLDADLGTTRQILDEREAWIESLSKELATVYGSRSWRLMGPFRVLARKLRTLRTLLAFQGRRFNNLAHRGRLSIATRGLMGTWRHLRNRRGPLTPTLTQGPIATPTSLVPPASLPTAAEPLVSIIIPVYGKLAYTCACLASLLEHAGDIPFEVIVVDDCSPDNSAEALAKVDGLRLLRNAENQGFIGSCNAGAAAARGRWLLFLNNDTVVTAGWLEALLATYDDFPDAGLVGARLVYPDGRLQEAGGLVFSDGSGWNYGRFEDPADPRYSYARPAHYCSGAAIVIERELFDALDGFDTRYAPAYYEDTDLAFKVRDAGRQVIYQPASTVIHFEGITSGTDVASGIKRHQVINQETFRERWREQLQRLPAPGTPVDTIARGERRKRVLVIDATVPEPDQDSGSVRLVNILRLLRESGRHVTFFADNRAYVPGYSGRLQRMGIETLFHPWLEHPVNWLREHGHELEAVLVSRHYIAANYLEPVRQYAPRARFIFDTVDLHYLREERAAALTGSEEIRRESARTRVQEQRLIRAADVTLVVSPAEQTLLATELPGSRVDVLSNVHPVPGRRREFAERHDLMFVGGFQHPPNVDAVQWLCSEVFPQIRTALPDVRLHIIGSKMPPEIANLRADGVVIQGFVEDLEPFLDGCRIAVAPLRYGAGVKGKINMSMSYGQPVVATGVAVEGMYLSPDHDVLVGDDARTMAAQIIRVYDDETLWRQLSDAGLDNVRQHFSFEAARQALERVLTG